MQCVDFVFLYFCKIEYYYVKNNIIIRHSYYNKPIHEMSHFTFTRYLYNKELVFETLEKTLIQGLYEESLFWGYELYFSGFETEVFEKCIEIYNAYFNNYKKLGNFFLKKKREWILEKSKHEILAILIKNMCIRKCDLSKQEPKREMYVIIDSAQIENYLTKTIAPLWKTLPTLCKYDLHVTKEFSKECFENLRDNWIFYASYCPLWKTRILENGGEINIAEKKVEFREGDDYERFYETYGFEFDEQSSQIQHRCLGIKI